MTLDRQRTERHLTSGDLQTLFVEELGWDNPAVRYPEEIETDGKHFSLIPVAEKRGVRIFRCNEIPDRPLRRKIEKEITKRAFEHLIIFLDADTHQQIWQWVAREKGKPDAFREHRWHTDRSPEPLLQKLDHITFSLEEEEALTLAGTTLRLRDAFDREKITKKFYDAFKKQHDRFLGFIEGLTNTADRQWYASLMLNRLMFVYFIQKKGFLDGDINYLRNRLTQVRDTWGEGNFHSFYRAFLLKLFHGGLAIPMDQRDVETDRLIGRIPYLNGGLFEPHILEGDDSDIQIADAAFEAVFAFFDQYEWTLDTRAIARADGKEINPDVLGHIFEKYINQKQMGAYYTKEDITDYITKNTVIPWLFQTAQSLDKIAFEPGGVVWRLLSDSPDSYIYPAVSHGTERELPANVAVGIKDVSSRSDWNKEAAEIYALPTEIWRETIARRQRHKEVRQKIATGRITKIEDLITYNLDIRQFARDVIQYAESPDLVRAFWKGISSIKVLDPACGSGAFLFAALGILYDLYDACLERMEQFVNTAPEPTGGRAQLYSDFRGVLKQVSTHPNRAYYIYKSIIISNLYGVDLMEEAVEICKLRLFLKLAAQLEKPEQIEPLPDIDFNIRAGNSLIGYTSFDDVRRATAAAGFDFDDRAGQIETAAGDLDKAFQLFRQQQTELHGAIEADHKSELRKRLNELGGQLDRFLAEDYGVKVGDDLTSCKVFESWKHDYKPFNWLIEFFGILSAGGFNVIVGNPPYLEAREVKYSPKGLRTGISKAVHGFFVERSNDLLSPIGGMSMILPMSLVSTQRMKLVQDVLERDRITWYSNFAWRPAKLFDQVNRALTIFISIPNEEKTVFSTGYSKWTASSRSALIPGITYVSTPTNRDTFWVPKFQSGSEHEILRKVLQQELSIEQIWGKGPGVVYYRTTGGLYWKVFTNHAPKFFVNGKAGSSSRETHMPIRQGYDPVIVTALLSSSTFWWWYTVESNLRDLNPSDIQGFRTNSAIFEDTSLAKLGGKYLQDLEENSHMLTRRQKQTGTTQTQSFKVQKSKPIIDEIDAVLASYYKFNAEELDFIQNYDIKYRLGASADDER